MRSNLDGKYSRRPIDHLVGEVWRHVPGVPDVSSDNKNEHFLLYNGQKEQKKQKTLVKLHGNYMELKPWNPIVDYIF